MQQNPTPPPAKKKTSPQNILTVEEVVARTVFEKEFEGLKEVIKGQQSLMWQIVIGVAVAFILAVGVIVVDDVMSNNTNVDQFNSVRKELDEQSASINNAQNDIKNIRVRNPYLK